jgi:ABC-type uncharacterized transport system permease subunit
MKLPLKKKVQSDKSKRDWTFIIITGIFLVVIGWNVAKNLIDTSNSMDFNLKVGSSDVVVFAILVVGLIFAKVRSKRG